MWVSALLSLADDDEAPRTTKVRGGVVRGDGQGEKRGGASVVIDTRAGVDVVGRQRSSGENRRRTGETTREKNGDGVVDSENVTKTTYRPLRRRYRCCSAFF